MGDVKGECKAHGHLGAVHMSLANYTNAMKCYEEQLERAKELKVIDINFASPIVSFPLITNTDVHNYIIGTHVIVRE